MAKAGNHGIIIPRDPELLRCMYWDEQMSLPEMARAFGVTHKSVERAMRELGIERRHKSHKRSFGCRVCNAPTHKIKHFGNGSWYGTLCKRHWNEHRAAIARKEARQPKVRAQRKANMQRWYHIGAINPKGEEQWLTKSKALLRTARRLAKTGRLVASPSRSAESALDQILQDSSPR